MNISVKDVESLANKLFNEYGRKLEIDNSSVKVKLLTQEKLMSMNKFVKSLSKIRDTYYTKNDDILIHDNDRYLLVSNDMLEVNEKTFIDAIDMRLFGFNTNGCVIPRSFRSLLSYSKDENQLMNVVYFKLGLSDTSTRVIYCFTDDKGLKVECRFK